MRVVDVDRDSTDLDGFPDAISGALIAFDHHWEFEQFKVLMEALEVYVERNEKYKDNWRAMGWRGMLIRLRERSERLWDDLWNAPYELNDLEPGTAASGGMATIKTTKVEYNTDDAIDAINFAALLVRAVREGNRDGTWWVGIK